MSKKYKKLNKNHEKIDQTNWQLAKYRSKITGKCWKMDENWPKLWTKIVENHRNSGKNLTKIDLKYKIIRQEISKIG